MNDIDLLRRAKYYMDRMSLGENPVTDLPFGADSEINGENFRRCFKYISSVLDEEIEKRSGKSKSAKYAFRENRSDFYLSDEVKRTVHISSDPVGINTVAARINDVIDQNSMKGVSGGKLAECLVKMGFLQIEENADGGRIRTATLKGTAAGIVTIDKTDSVGKAYRQNLYSEEMQRFLIENINEIMRYARSHSAEDEDRDGKESKCEKEDIADIEKINAENFDDADNADDDFYGL